MIKLRRYGLFFLLLSLATLGTAADVGKGTAARDTAAFLDRHWQRPIAPQGTPPAGFSPQEASLSPQDCGACHPQQFKDWQSALHSKAMGPGLLGQLQAMAADATDEHQACLMCHAPLAEQQTDLQKALTAGKAKLGAHADGLTCAGCHVRGHQHHGPPRADGSSPSAGDRLPHGGWQVSAAFGNSRFCAACHQFPADWPALNGKLLENTYEEWKASRYARENRPCQSCHMPDRRHLWRGIHDPEMTRQGLTIAFSPLASSQSRVAAELAITNSGIGHAFPTYVTPRVTVEIAQEDAAGQRIPGTKQTHRIARDVSADLSKEIADTRILPDETRRYAYRRPRHAKAVALIARIIVEPDHFYANFYRATLRDPAYRQGHATLREALRQAEQSPYLLDQTRLALPGAGH